MPSDKVRLWEQLGASGERIRNMKGAGVWAWLGLANLPAAAPAAHPTLDSGPQAPEAVDERGRGWGGIPAAGGQLSLRQLREAGPSSHREASPATWLLGVGTLAAPTLKRIPRRTKFTSRGTLRRGALTLSEAGRWLPPGLQMRRAGGGGLVSDITSFAHDGDRATGSRWAKGGPR